MLTLMAIAVAIALIFVVVCLTRTDSVPIFIRKLNAQSRAPLDPSVAFENPGYGTEVQIRGLPGGDMDAPTSTHIHADEGSWQRAKLESPPHDDDDDGRHSPPIEVTLNNQQKGMRYAKLT